MFLCTTVNISNHHGLSVVLHKWTVDITLSKLKTVITQIRVKPMGHGLKCQSEDYR